MKDSLIVGLMLGLIAGAVIVSNNKKAQEMVQKGQKEVKKQLKKM